VGINPFSLTTEEHTAISLLYKIRQDVTPFCDYSASKFFTGEETYVIPWWRPLRSRCVRCMRQQKHAFQTTNKMHAASKQSNGHRHRVTSPLSFCSGGLIIMSNQYLVIFVRKFKKLKAEVKWQLIIVSFTRS